MFFIVIFLIFWIIWFIFSDKKRWRELFSIAFFASALGSTTDHIMHYYDFWRYHDSIINRFVLNAIDDWGVYIVVTYLFIQWLPRKKTNINMFLYWVIWTTVAISMEWIHLRTNHMSHHNGWTLFHSYISDWILFWLFYKVHGVFQYKKLNE